MKTRRLAIILLGLSLAVAVIGLWRFSLKKAEESHVVQAVPVQREQGANDPADGDQPMNEPRHSQRELNFIELVGIQEVPEFRAKDTSVAKNMTFPAPDGRTVTLHLKSNAEILKIVPNSSHSLYLLQQGGQREWGVYDKQGEHVVDLPLVSDLAPDVSGHASVQWRWRLDNALVASVETYPHQDPSVPRYPEEDVTPTDLRFYDYRLDSKTARKIKIPEVMSNGLLRLEGVSTEGALVISKISADGDYWGKRDSSELHAFHVADDQQKSEEHNKAQQDNR